MMTLREYSPDFMQRIFLAITAIFLFVVVSSKGAYKVTNHVVKTLNDSGDPTAAGYTIHGIVFGVLFYFSTYLLI